MEGIRLETRAKFTGKLSENSVSSARKLITMYETVEQEFNDKMVDASIRNRAELEAQKLYLEELN